MTKPLNMDITIRKHHKKLVAIFAMIETLDKRIAYDTAQLNLHPDVIFWANAHAKKINKDKRTRLRLYAYYTNSFAAMAEKALSRKKPEPVGNYLRSEHGELTINFSNQ